jgi:integrase
VHAKLPPSEKDNARQGFFEREDFERLGAFLPEDLKDYVRFGYLTGWRKGEIAQLAWEHVEAHAIRLPPHISKNKDGRVLTLVGQLAEILERRRALRRDDIPWVFFRDTGQPVKRFARSWKTASHKAELPVPVEKNKRKTFHALRRTSARDLSCAGVPDRIAMQLMGHKTRSIDDRYNIVNEDDISTALTRAEEYRTRRSHILATSEKHEQGEETV